MLSVLNEFRGLWSVWTALDVLLPGPSVLGLAV